MQIDPIDETDKQILDVTNPATNMTPLTATEKNFGRYDESPSKIVARPQTRQPPEDYSVF